MTAPPFAPRPVALVTGAARRLGRAIVLDMAAHGHDVALHYRGSRADAEATLADAQALGAAAAAFGCDLADEAACRALVPRVLARFGRLDAVVNSAATFEHDDAASFGHAAMERHWRANTAPAILLAQALHAHLTASPAAEDGAQRNGCVVNLLDQKLWNPNPDFLSYTLSKAALRTATLLLAQALAPRLRVCGVAPGLTLGSDAIDDARLAALQAAASPRGYGPAPADVAAAVRFLIEARAVTGTIVLVDAGQHLRPAPRDFAFMGDGAA